MENIKKEAEKEVENIKKEVSLFVCEVCGKSNFSKKGELLCPHESSTPPQIYRNSNQPHQRRRLLFAMSDMQILL